MLDSIFISPLEQFEIQLIKPIIIDFGGIFCWFSEIFFRILKNTENGSLDRFVFELVGLEFLGLILDYIGSIVWDLSITNSTLSILFGFVIVILLLKEETQRYIPTKKQLLQEKFYLFIYTVVEQQAGKKGIKYFPILFVLFTMIFSINILGMLPYNFTATSHIIITLTIGLSFFFGIVIIGIITQGLKWFLLFVPKNVPVWLLPLLIIIEIFSYIIRPFSIAIRLFANMLAGHTLLHIVAGFILNIFKIDFILGNIVLVLLMAILVLEIGIAFLQAYVFLVLTSIYLNESLYGH